MSVLSSAAITKSVRALLLIHELKWSVIIFVKGGMTYIMKERKIIPSTVFFVAMNTFLNKGWSLKWWHENLFLLLYMTCISYLHANQHTHTQNCVNVFAVQTDQKVTSNWKAHLLHGWFTLSNTLKKYEAKLSELKMTTKQQKSATYAWHELNLSSLNWTLMKNTFLL